MDRFIEYFVQTPGCKVAIGGGIALVIMALLMAFVIQFEPLAIMVGSSVTLGGIVGGGMKALQQMHQ